MPNKKIAITGHTSGLGKALFDYFIQKNFIVEGFSRQNGYDISHPEIQLNLIDKLASSDLFINNAHSGWAQIELLYSLFERWKNLPKHIINISSNSGDGIKNYQHPYAVQKNALDKASEQLNHIKNAQCRVTNLRPGWIKTERISQMRVTDPQLSVDNLVQLIDWIVQLPSSMHIPTLNVIARDL